jgi:hypothetical protein
MAMIATRIMSSTGCLTFFFKMLMIISPILYLYKSFDKKDLCSKALPLLYKSFEKE